MRFTSERVIPDRYELKPMLQEHLRRYTFALPFIQDADVIDLGCGCGYGTHLLATQGARSAVGVDISAEAVAYARDHYVTPNLSFNVMDVTTLGCADHSFTAAVCLEVFEHVHDYEALLKEAIRVLIPGGTLVLSTPNKAVWSPGRDTPINPWHICEFTREQFGGIMESHLSDVRYWSQTNPTPGIIPFILANLRLQRYYVRSHSPLARSVEWLYNTFLKVIMLPPHLIPGALDNDPSIIVPEQDVDRDEQHFFLAVGRTAPRQAGGSLV